LIPVFVLIFLIERFVKEKVFMLSSI
jgi:hypothetical protein